MKVNGQMKQELRDELRRRPWGRLLLWVGICSRKFKEGSGLLGNPLVLIQARDVRQWELHYVQRSRDESSARAAMARVRNAGLGSRRGGEGRRGMRVLGTGAMTGWWQVICLLLLHWWRGASMLLFCVLSVGSRN